MAGGAVVVDEDGVVEVAGGFAVDGDDRQIAEVAAGGDDFGVEMGDFAGFGEDFVGEDAREMVLADNDLDVDAEVVRMAEDFDDAAAGGAVGVGKPVISTSTTRPSRLFGSWSADAGAGLLRRGRGAEWHGVRRGDSAVVGDDDGLGHALVEGGDVVAGEALPATCLRVRSGRCRRRWGCGG